MNTHPTTVCALILICGLPGSGKTTVAKQIEIERNAILMCPDAWIEAILGDPEDVPERDRLRDPVENLQWELAQTYLAKGFTVILENGFWAEEERTLYAIGAVELGARIELIYLEAPDFGKLWERVERRNEKMPSKTFVMTQEDLRVGWNQFQPPDSLEMAFYDDAVTIPWRDD